MSGSQFPLDTRKGRGPRIAALSFFVVVALVSVIALTINVFQKQRELQVASSDSVVWTLSQLEVEYLKFSRALQEAIAEPENPTRLRELRQKFDIFYSRLDTVQNVQTLFDNVDSPATRQTFVFMQAQLNSLIPLIDGDNETLAQGLPSMAVRDGLIAPKVREISLANLKHSIASTSVGRESVLTTMQVLGVLTVVLIAALATLSFFLFRAAQRNEDQAVEQRLLAARLQTILDTSLDAVLVIDIDGMVHQFNGAAEEVFGYSQDEVIGKDIADLIIPETYRRAHEIGMQRMRDRGEKRLAGSGRVEIEAKRKSGALFPIELSIEEVVTEDGRLFVSFVRDISDRKRAEAELVDARDSALAGERTKSRFLAIMSHEMRTPLNGLLGMLDLMRQSKTDEHQKFYIENMEFSGQVLLDLINNILDLTKLDTEVDTLNNASFDPERLINEVMSSQLALARKRGNYLNYEWVGTAVTGIFSDRARMRQILMNLINNAIKFTENGEVTVEAEILEPLTVDGRPELELRVLDTGCGIPDTEIDRVFDDFETLDSVYDRTTEGSGLGLGIVRRLVEMMNGQIGVESEVGEGSLFWVRLPVVVSDFKSEPEPAPVMAALGQAANLLMVEDNEINRRVLREMLESQGHTVAEAHDGTQAVEKASLERFDAILMDISMPGMDGTDATRHIRASGGPNCLTPIIAVTAHAMPDEMETFTAAGINAILNKPVMRQELFRVLNHWISDEDLDGEDHGDLPPEPDDNVIRALARDMSHADISSLVSRFVRETDLMIQEIRSLASDEENRKEITSHVHKTAGAAGSFGLTDFHHDLARAQTQLKTDPSLVLGDCVEKLASSWKIAREEVADTAEELSIDIGV